MFGRRKLAAIIAEFVGTYFLVSVILALTTRTQFPFFAAVAAGATLALAALTVARVSGAHLNPAVTVGLWTMRKIQTTQAVIYVAAQMLAGFTAFRVSEQLIGAKLQNAAGQNVDWRIMVAEALGAFVLGIGYAAVVHQALDGAKLAATIGLALAVGMLVASLGSNAALNPAVAVGIHSWSLSYFVGPIIGAALGMNIYSVLFAPLNSNSIKRAKR